MSMFMSAGTVEVPDPFEPGRYKVSSFGSYALFSSSWASHDDVVNHVMEGRYDCLTPKVAEFIPTLECPFDCPTCSNKVPKARLKHISIPLELAKSCILKLHEGGCNQLIITGGGEPTCYNGLGEIVKYAKSLDMRIMMTTNGTFAGNDFTPEDVIKFSLDKIRISLNTIENHALFHGYHKEYKNWLPVVLENIERIVVAKKSLQKMLTAGTEIQICILFDEMNHREIPRVIEQMADVHRGIDSFVVRPAIDYFGSSQVPAEVVKDVQQSVINLIKKRGIQNLRIFMPPHRLISLGLAQRDYSQCRAAGLVTQVYADVGVYLCTEGNGYEGYKIGDLSSCRSITEIYSGRRFRKVIERINREGCRKCPVTCRPTRINSVFSKIEALRAHDEALLRQWLRDLRAHHEAPGYWIEG